MEPPSTPGSFLGDRNEARVRGEEPTPASAVDEGMDSTLRFPSRPEGRHRAPRRGKLRGYVGAPHFARNRRSKGGVLVGGLNVPHGVQVEILGDHDVGWECS